MSGFTFRATTYRSGGRMKEEIVVWGFTPGGQPNGNWQSAWPQRREGFQPIAERMEGGREFTISVPLNIALQDFKVGTEFQKMRLFTCNTPKTPWITCGYFEMAHLVVSNAQRLTPKTRAQIKDHDFYYAHKRTGMGTDLLRQHAVTFFTVEPIIWAPQP